MKKYIMKLIFSFTLLYSVTLFSDTVLSQTCTDGDGDGYGLNGDASCTNAGVDCNDNDILINPGAAEGPFGDGTCSDGADNNCDGNTDGADINCSDPDVDDDGDGFTENQGDCNDGNTTMYPFAPILCDGLDNNCDGILDFKTDVDVDEDGVPRCGGDCDDSDPLRYPGNAEFFGDISCSDGIDNDCDNRIDILDPQCADNCTDNDGDGYGNPGHSSCSNGSATDCNDNNAAINPGATDTDCNGVDDNCSGTADEGYVAPPTICGVGECARTGLDECQSGTIVDTCTPGAPQPECPLPGDPSNTDGLDNDCDALIDECPIGPCWDVDGDGYGAFGDPSCPNGTLVDCDDDDPTIPRAELADDCNGIDEDCSGIPDDAYVPIPTICGEGVCASTGLRECIGGTEVDNCTPGTPTEDPEATCDDGLDNDCDGLTDKISGIIDPDCDDSKIDNDGDGFCADPFVCTDGSLPGDCDDTNNTVFLNAPILCDGLDNNCDGILDFKTDVDVDEDRVPRCGGDCDDSDPLRYPGNAEFFGDISCSDGIDNDCDNRIDILDPQCADTCTDNDGDGYGNPGHSSCSNGSATDCNDNNAAINPGATDTDCNGVDDNCSGTADEGYVAPPTICGVGECASTGLDECQSGTIVDTCSPGAPQPECPLPGDPSNTDGLDNDCDALIDECPIGPCWDVDGDGYGAFGDPSCPNGTLVDCDDDDPTIPRAELADDCNGIDEDCSGIPDDAYVPIPTICGEGVCASTGLRECIGGTEVDNCTPGTPTEDPEATCDDGLDNDCDGLTDKISGIIDPDCDDSKIDNDGDGFCADLFACTDGSLPGDCDDTNDTVHPGAPILCDGLDNNCDGIQDFGTDRDDDGDGVPRCGGDCDDNDPLRYPGNQEIYGDPSCSDGIDNDCSGVVDDCPIPTCDTKVAPRNGPHMFDLMDPGVDPVDHADDTLVTSSCSWCHTDILLGTGTVNQRPDCQRCHADPTDTSDLLNGVLKDPDNPNAYPGNPPYGFGTALNVKLHSSTVLGTKYGSWDMDCLTCHNPHLQEQDARYGTSYGKYIKEYICFDNPVTGLYIEEIVEFTAATGEGSFADGPPHNENICEMCHTQTTYHRNDGSSAAHNDGTHCTECHPHIDGFKASCGACHELPPPTGSHLKHFGGNPDFAEYGNTGITQDYVSQGTDYIMNCGNCHPMDSANHQNGLPNAGGGDAEIELYNANAPAGSLKAMNPPTATYTPGATVFTDANGLKYTTGTCDNVYCHSVTDFSSSAAVPEPAPFIFPKEYTPPWQSFVITATSYQTTLTWGTASDIDGIMCNNCHGYPILSEFPTVSAGAGDSHGWVDDFGYIDLHVWNMGFDPLQCYTCHYDTVKDYAAWVRSDTSIEFSDITIFNTANHINGTKDILFTTDDIFYPSNLDLNSATFDPATKTCSNVACHIAENEVIWGSPYRWWNSTECNSCHNIGLPDRHHLLINTIIPDPTSAPFGTPGSLYECLSCHEEDSSSGDVVFVVERECVVCHTK